MMGNGTMASVSNRLSVLEVVGLSHRYGETVSVSDVSLRVEPGMTMALLGPSGCGKTTLLRLIAGLESPDSGTITVGDRTMVGQGAFVAAENRRIGMVFQDGGLFPHLSVAKNVAYGLNGRPNSEAKVRKALAMVDLDGFEDRMPDTLSGGQAQRVAIARSLSPEPDILLLDEPFASLDSDLRARVRGEVVGLLADLGITSVFVTHDREEAFVVGDEVAVMRSGVIEQVGTPADLYADPSSVWVASFVGDVNVFEADVVDGRATTLIGPVELDRAVSGHHRVLVRPEDVVFEEGGMAVVRQVDFYGHDTSYTLDVDGTTVRARAMASPTHRAGDRVNLSHRGGQVKAFPEAP